MQRYPSDRPLGKAQELLTLISKKDVRPERKKRHTPSWGHILVPCCSILVLAALGKGFLYLDTQTSTVQSAVRSAAKDVAMLRAQMAATDARERLTALTAELDELKGTNRRLQVEVLQLRETVEAVKGRKNNSGTAQPRRK